MIQLLQIDGKIPNLAIMRLAAHFRSLGEEITFRRADSLDSVSVDKFNAKDKIYASAIFSRSIPVVSALINVRPDTVVGGTGISYKTSLEGIGVISQSLDYSIYPTETRSIGFTQRGCRLSCSFCVVPAMEGKVKSIASVRDIWRGDPWPKQLLLLDNDFFGQSNWRQIISEIREGRFKVSFNQGINARCLTDEAAEAIASIDYRDDSMKVKRIYTAWDSRKDEERLFQGLNRLVQYGVKPDHIMVYMLIGYWPGETSKDREYRRAKLREFGARPYPMAYINDSTPPDLAKELRGFQRWVIRRCDLKCSWEDFSRVGYRPEKLGIAN